MLLFEMADNEVDYLKGIMDNFPDNILITKSKNRAHRDDRDFMEFIAERE